MDRLLVIAKYRDRLTDKQKDLEIKCQVENWIEWKRSPSVLPIYLYLSMLLKEQPYFRLTMGKTKHFLNADRQTEI